jgi:dipeptidase D
MLNMDQNQPQPEGLINAVTNSDPAVDLSDTGMPKVRTCGTGINPVLRGLGPQAIWEHFDHLARIPRPSGFEEPVREHLRALAAGYGFQVKEDKAGNLVICVPGRGAGVNAPTVVIQSHMDMVCVKDPGVTHDFMTDAIQLQVTDRNISGATKKVLAAIGTTLGADNGVGLCTGLAAATSNEITDCPPLELLCTFDEERGLTGAKELDPAIVTGRLLLNLDTEEHGCIYISCAGGRDMVAEWALTREKPAATEVPVRVTIAGLPGGHSGAEIHEGRGNANLMMLSALLDPSVAPTGARLASLDGGSKRNVIPSHTEAVLWVPQEKVADLKVALGAASLKSGLQAGIEAKYHNFTLTLDEIDRNGVLDPLSATDSLKLISAISAIPNGVQSWSPVKSDLVETSNNVAVFHTTADQLQVCCMTRSSKDGAIDAFQDDAIKKLAPTGAAVRYEHHSPGWEADPNNPLLTRAQKIFTGILGTPPKIMAIHAGLECGAFRQHIPDIKMISFGPDIREAHTTKECIALDSVPPFWECVKGLLKDLCH